MIYGVSGQFYGGHGCPGAAVLLGGAFVVGWMTGSGALDAPLACGGLGVLRRRLHEARLDSAGAIAHEVHNQRALSGRPPMPGPSREPGSTTLPRCTGSSATRRGQRSVPRRRQPRR